MGDVEAIDKGLALECNCSHVRFYQMGRGFRGTWYCYNGVGSYSYSVDSHYVGGSIWVRVSKRFKFEGKLCDPLLIEDLRVWHAGVLVRALVASRSL